MNIEWVTDFLTYIVASSKEKASSNFAVNQRQNCELKLNSSAIDELGNWCQERLVGGPAQG